MNKMDKTLQDFCKHFFTITNTLKKYTLLYQKTDINCDLDFQLDLDSTVNRLLEMRQDKQFQTHVIEKVYRR